MISCFHCVKGETVKAGEYASSGLLLSIPSPLLYPFLLQSCRWNAMVKDLVCGYICVAATMLLCPMPRRLCAVPDFSVLVPCVGAWHKAPASYLAVRSGCSVAHTEVSAVSTTLLLIPLLLFSLQVNFKVCHRDSSVGLYSFCSVFFFIPCHITIILVVLAQLFGDHTSKHCCWKKLIFK